jgi:transcriptional regulator with XRE-family HTH domain
MSSGQDQPELELAAWIRAARRRAGLSQLELAEQLGIAQSSISQWEKGLTQPATPHMLTLLRMFPASVPELLAVPAASNERPSDQEAPA